jgi:hypothetical protein
MTRICSNSKRKLIVSGLGIWEEIILKKPMMFMKQVRMSNISIQWLKINLRKYKQKYDKEDTV